MDFNIILQFIVDAAQNSWAVLSMFWVWFWQYAWPWIWEWVIVAILYKAIAVHFMAKWLLSWGKKHLVKTRDQIALYHHYRDRAMKRGHRSDPSICADGMCREVNASK